MSRDIVVARIVAQAREGGVSAVRWDCPTVPDKSKVFGEAEAPCISDTLHVHVWPELVGIWVRTHGNVISLGKFPGDVYRGELVRPGRFFGWRTRRAIAKAVREVDVLHRRHESIGQTYAAERAALRPTQEEVR